MSSLYWNLASQQWKYLSEITRAIAENLDLGTVLTRALRYAVELVEGEAGLIALREPDGQFRFAAHVGVEAAALPIFEPLLEQIPLTLQEEAGGWQFPELTLRFTGLQNRGLGLKYVMAIPLVASRRLLGLILVFRSPRAPAFGQLEQDGLASFADHVAVAVQNAQVYAESRRRAQELESIIEGSTNALVIAEPDGRLRHINHAFQDLTGWSASDIHVLSLTQVLRLRDERGELVPLPTFDSSHTSVFVADAYLERRDGSRGAFVHVILAPLYDASRTLFSLLCSLVDISLLRESQDVKTALLAGISHDFKTPLALIRGYAETLRNPDVELDPAARDESLRIIEEEAEYLNSLVNSLLDAAQLQVGHLTLRREPVRLDELAAEIVRRFQGLGDAREWVLEFPSTLPAVSADPERLRQVLQNLISNAVKYSPSGTCIQVGGWVEPERVGIVVRDQGPGIPAEEQARLFEKFSRGRGQAARAQRGSGLGLYVSRAIVEQHGGRLWTENLPSGGAAFYFTLPLSRAEPLDRHAERSPIERQPKR